MAGINKVLLIGNVGKVESKTSKAGDLYVEFSIATSFKKKDGQEEVEWHNLKAFGKTAEIISKWVTKGSKLFIEGQLKTEKWQNQAGEDRYATKIIVKEVQMLDSKEKGVQAQTQSDPSSYQAAKDGTIPPPPPIDEFDDGADLPF